MQNENTYIGDDKFQKFLDHYNCPTPLQTVKFKFVGAICSPYTGLRPTDVISSLFYPEHQPRLVTKNEAELFFKFFMGLWDEMFTLVQLNKVKIPEITRRDRENLYDFCLRRCDMVEFGFVEGFWAGQENLTIPNFAAELIASLSDMAGVYKMLGDKLEKSGNGEEILQALENTDKTVQKTINFLIENLVLPNMEKLKQQIN